jgi:hypothetical protein
MHARRLTQQETGTADISRRRCAPPQGGDGRRLGYAGQTMDCVVGRLSLVQQTGLGAGVHLLRVAKSWLALLAME